jgi:hypothetical protein
MPPLAIRDAFAIEVIDDRENYGEERVNLIGINNGRSQNGAAGCKTGLR